MLRWSACRNYITVELGIKFMDPRPYNYEYRKPRFSNPTLYTFSNLANLAISTKVSTILARFKNSTPTMIKLITIAPLTMGLP